MEYKDLNDYEILYMINENDEFNKKILFDKYKPIILKIANYFYNYMPSNGLEIDDLIQEGYIALDNAIKTYNKDSGVLFYTYVNLCIRRHLSTFCKSNNNYKNYILNNSCNIDDCLDVCDKNVNFNNLDYFMLEADFKLILYNFDLVDSCIFELKYNGFSYKEISKLLDLPISVVDSRLVKVRKKIKNLRLIQ